MPNKTRPLSVFLILIALSVAEGPRGVAAETPVTGTTDAGPDIHLGIVENTKLAGGQHRSSALFLYHRTTNADGSLYSSHYLFYVNAPEFTAVLPLWYQVGAPGHEHTMLVPLWFQGPGYGLAPLALSGGWQRADGGSSLWLTPLFHRDRNVAGATENLHLLNWFQGEHSSFLLPLFYRQGVPGHEHTGLVPLWFSGPDYWTTPLALSAGWQRSEGGDSTWITPLFHIGHAADGRADGMHVLNWYHNQDRDVIFPLYWSSGPAEARHHALVPLWVDGPGYSGLPALLSGTWQNSIGGRTTWVTPLFHSSTDHNGNLSSLHVLNWLHRPDRDIVIPLAWVNHDTNHSTNHSTGTVFPLWFGGDTWWIAPPLLSGGTHRLDGERSQWLTPLFHQHHSADGQRSSYHALTWFAGADRGPEPSSYQGLFPLWYQDTKQIGEQTSTRTAVIPLWFGGPDITIIPPLLSGSWQSTDKQSTDKSTTTWITPLFHRTTEADGTLANMHAGLWYQDHQASGSAEEKNLTSREHAVLFPLFWYSSSTADGRSRTHTTLFPLWFSGPDYRIAPPLLSWSTRQGDGTTSTWITPLFHVTRDADGQRTGMHALTWIQSGDTRMLLPFYCTTGAAGDQTTSIVPLWTANREGWTAPLLLSWQRHFSDGSKSTWITPLAHVSHDPDGSLSSLHVLNWIQSKDVQLLFPLAYRGGPQGQRHRGLIPLVFTGPDYWVLPPALSAGWTASDGSTATWITPLFHQNRSPDGQLASRHVLNWFEGKDWQLLFPLAYRNGPPEQRHQGVVPLVFTGPDYWAVPLALSGGGKRRDGGDTTWITPLFHVSHAADGHRDGLHALTWLSSDTGHALLPFYYDYSRPNEARQAVIPLWFTSPSGTTVPLLLSGRWHDADGHHSTWVTPLFHRGSDAAGTTTDWHALNVIHSGDTTVIAPLAWFSGSAEKRERVILPFYFQGSEHLVIAPLYYRTTGPEGSHDGLLPLWFSGPDWWTAPLALSAGWSNGSRRTAMITPLYHRTTDHGTTRDLHLLNYFSSPEMQTVAPLYWQWPTAAGGQRTVLAPLWYQHRGTNDEFTGTAMPLLFSYHQGAELDTSVGYQLFPFIVQNTADGHEINALWRLVHVREQHGSTETTVWPLWWSEHREQAPASWQVLGGLFGRECDRERHTSLSYAAWGALRFDRTSYATP